MGLSSQAAVLQGIDVQYGLYVSLLSQAAVSQGVDVQCLYFGSLYLAPVRINVQCGLQEVWVQALGLDVQHPGRQAQSRGYVLVIGALFAGQASSVDLFMRSTLE